jgi:hypothetical protein
MWHKVATGRFAPELRELCDDKRGPAAIAYPSGIGVRRCFVGDAGERLVETRLAVLRDAPASALSPEETQGSPSRALLDSTLVMAILPL